MRTRRASTAALAAVLATLLAAGAALAVAHGPKTGKRVAQRPVTAARAASASVDSESVVGPPPPASALPAGAELKVERSSPVPQAPPTLRFLRANAEWLQQPQPSRVDPRERRTRAEDLDPHALEDSRMLAEALASRDSVDQAADALSRQHMIESIAQLGALESRLDLVEHELGRQRVRLAHLEDDFSAHPQTSLLVLLSGYPKDLPVSEVTLTFDDGAPIRVSLSPEQRQSLRHGGVLELFHGFAEPREQVVQVTLGGAEISGGDSGFVTISPMRDRLTFLRFDLSAVGPAQGAASVRASTWLHEPGAGRVQG